MCGLCRFESQHGIILRFIVGSVSDPVQEAVLQAEQRKHGDILRLPLQVCPAYLSPYHLSRYDSCRLPPL